MKRTHLPPERKVPHPTRFGCVIHLALLSVTAALTAGRNGIQATFDAILTVTLRGL